MSETENPFSDIDAQTTTTVRVDSDVASKASYGVSAERRAMLSNCKGPLHVLQSYGVEMDHLNYNPEDAYEYPSTIEVNGTRFHLHQDVKEDFDDTFGNFGDVEDDEDVVWTIVDLMDGTASITVVGDWGRRRHVPFKKLEREYRPIYLKDGQPKWGY